MEDALYLAAFVLAVALAGFSLWEFFFGQRDKPKDLHESNAYDDDDGYGDADDD